MQSNTIVDSDFSAIGRNNVFIEKSSDTASAVKIKKSSLTLFLNPGATLAPDSEQNNENKIDTATEQNRKTAGLCTCDNQRNVGL